jgi:hypothetical protein
MTELITNGAAIKGMDPGPTGTVLYPNDPDWDEARTPWVVNVDQQPAPVALVWSVDDVSAVVASAAPPRTEGDGIIHCTRSSAGRPSQPHRTGAYCRVERSSCQPSRAHGMGRLEHGVVACAGHTSRPDFSCLQSQ